MGVCLPIQAQKGELGSEGHSNPGGFWSFAHDEINGRVKQRVTDELDGEPPANSKPMRHLYSTGSDLSRSRRTVNI